MKPADDGAAAGQPADAPVVAAPPPLAANPHRALPALLQGLDRLCRESHDLAVEGLSDDDRVTLGPHETIRFAVYLCLREFRCREAEIRRAFVHRLETQFASASDAGLPVATCAADPAALGAAAFAREALCTALVHGIRNDAAQAAAALARHLVPAAGADTDAQRALLHALDPRTVLDAYLQAIDVIGPEPELRVWLLRAVHARLLHGLPSLYRDCALAGPGPAACDETAACHGVVEALLHWLAARDDEAAPPDAGRNRTLARNALAALAACCDEAGAEAAIADERIESALDAADAALRRLGDADRGACDLVGMVFDALPEGPARTRARNADRLRPRLALLRTVLDDRRVLLAPGHPVRRLVETLMRSVSHADARDFAGGCRAAVEEALARIDGGGSVFADAGESVAPAPVAQRAPVAEPRHHVRSDALAVGEWVDFGDQGAAAMRLKLCWRGGFSGMHVFVDRAGVKALELTDGEVRTLIGRGRLRAVSPAAAAPR